MELYDVMRRTGSTREFRPEPVPDEVLHRILDHARFAGSGGNRQGWHVVVVRDPATRVAIRDLYSPIWDRYVEARMRGLVPFSPGTEMPTGEVPHRPNELADGLHEVPVMLLVVAELGSLAVTDNGLGRQSIVGGGSIYPFVQNLLLGATNEGLGAVLTTLLCPAEPRVRELIALPDTHALAAMVVLGWPRKPITKLTRRPVEAFCTVDRFDGAAFAAP